MSDYARVAKAIDFIAANVAGQPSLAEVAAHVQLSPFHFQRLFSRWVGVTPKRFLQVLTVEQAKHMLAASELPLLELSDELGLSSSSRLHDHFVQLEAVTPAQYRRAGAGLRILYGTAATPFGPAFVASTPRGLCKLAFVDDEDPLGDLRRAWPAAELIAAEGEANAVAKRVFSEPAQAAKPLSLYVRGTNFQVHVWRALLGIPPGRVASYGEIAAALGRPQAARAVGAAVGANPIAFVIPCHRVIEQSGKLGGYRWGLTRKRALQAWEAARHG